MSIEAKAFIGYVREVAEAIAFQAGVGGMETAGQIISYLAAHPSELEAFMERGVFAWPIDWFENGCLTWHAINGQIVHPADVRALRSKKITTREQADGN